MPEKTAGEIFLERDLEKERRAGVEHYVAGQLRCEEVTRDDEGRAALISGVLPLGAFRMVLEETEDGWKAVPGMFRVVGLSMDYGIQPVPPCYEPSEEILKLIEEADGGG